ncbi:YfdX protein [Orbus hercynius]|uniref:YfdX protein n=1 Tax=Orbus hercynius TaxID=593135 RepID=A0A495RL14_9GAMM|nr:YfdX family protein [Orbus hercynius]RKS87488.1 YfdX protein [Orbus hercynius]
MKRIMTATALSLALISGFSWADTATNTTGSVAAKVSSATDQQLQELTQIANQGFNAMRNIQYARLAIFGGNTELATKLVDQSATLLNDDSVDWSKFVKQAKNPDLTKNDDFVIIDASIALAEDYTVTPEKQAVIDKANAKLKNGDAKGALDDLRLADIAVNETQYLMPIKATRAAVTQAKQLLADGKYYEANLVLRDAEQAIVVTSETLIAGK